jgi:hypothetical protein
MTAAPTPSSTMPDPGTHRLAINAQFAVKIIQPSWIGKY